MAKLQDKFYNRVIEGKLLELSTDEKEALGIADVSSSTKIYKVSQVNDVKNIINDIKIGDIIRIAYYGGYSVVVSKTSSTVQLDLFSLETDKLQSKRIVFSKSGGTWQNASVSSIDLKEVTANPTLAGTESSLSGLQVGGTKYKVGGTQLYIHEISGTIHDEEDNVLLTFGEGRYLVMIGCRANAIEETADITNSLSTGDLWIVSGIDQTGAMLLGMDGDDNVFYIHYSGGGMVVDTTVLGSDNLTDIVHAY